MSTVMAKAAATPTRGERNCNPGNVDRTNPRTLWQGRLLPDSALTDTRFEQFTDAKWGIRAIVGTLMAYHDKHGLNTVRGLINRWAPPTENITTAYVSAVCEDAKVGPDTVLNLQDYNTMYGLVIGIINHENGRCIYADAVIEEGIKLAGVIKAVAQLPAVVATPTGKAATGTAAAGLVAIVIPHAAAIVAAAAPAVAPVVHALSPVAQLGIVGATLAGFLYWRSSIRQVVGT